MIILYQIFAFYLRCMTVIGSALKSEVQKDVMEYDAVDDAIISAEQGATIILNYLEPARVFLYWRTKNMEVIIL